MQSGEKRFAERLESKLDGDCLIWYDVPVGERAFHPDFIVLDPRAGILILEVKDWRLDTIERLDKKSATIRTANGSKKVTNPLEQARVYAHATLSQLEKDQKLKRSDGKLVLSWGYGVVLTSIMRKQFDALSMSDVINPRQVICKDEMLPSTDPEAFRKHLLDMHPAWNQKRALTQTQIDRVRWNIFPDIRIKPLQSTLFDEPSQDRIMDLEQERLARGLGPGHRVIHGAAGSGKTMILVHRCAYLINETKMKRPILVLCFNVTLASFLKSIIVEKGLQKQVTVRNFHGWCQDQLKSHRIKRPRDGKDYHKRLVQRTNEAVDQGKIPLAQYGAVLVDEAHDFEPDWLALAVKMADPKDGFLLLLYDDAQTIYGNVKRRSFSLSSVGIQARGRTKILSKNYRNTVEVLRVAYEFAKDSIKPRKADEDSIPLVSPEAAGRHGQVPRLVKQFSVEKEGEYIASELQRMNREEKTPWRDMAIIYRDRFIFEKISQSIKEKIPVEWIIEDKESRYYDVKENSVKVVTIHSSKGLEFNTVVIPGLGFLPRKNRDPEEESRLLYVAMTRSIDLLLLTYHRKTEFVRRIDDAIQLASHAAR